ncbi:hypothetical protein [uncultured Pseudodesulfovibrio sp.]|uniref:hypothetical protein n=1 Tax=uncultured Pseudodesulfovibrio sp. TaxID=2035858 RepID=UPI0029C78476|nr:hypothetical protein [uncultured Pseudodesulfovibrio sp.]
MRQFNNQSSAVSTAPARPFSGLGFAMESVSAAAQEMTVVYFRQDDGGDVFSVMPTLVAQPSGYLLLVALGREIRGR